MKEEDSHGYPPPSDIREIAARSAFRTSNTASLYS